MKYKFVPQCTSRSVPGFFDEVARFAYSEYLVQVLGYTANGTVVRDSAESPNVCHVPYNADFQTRIST